MYDFSLTIFSVACLICRVYVYEIGDEKNLVRRLECLLLTHVMKNIQKTCKAIIPFIRKFMVIFMSYEVQQLKLTKLVFV